jgi:hypothetical protein
MVCCKLEVIKVQGSGFLSDENLATFLHCRREQKRSFHKGDADV